MGLVATAETRPCLEPLLELDLILELELDLIFALELDLILALELD